MKLKLTVWLTAAIILMCASIVQAISPFPLVKPENNSPIFNQIEDYTAVYRLYNPQSADYVFTQNCDEKNTLSRNGSYNFESTAFYLATRQLRRTTPLYRLLLSNGEHFYTADNSEMTQLTQNNSGRLEGILGYIATESQRRTVPLYRLANGDRHLFTTSEQEKNNYLRTPGARLEGIAGYVWTSGSNSCDGSTLPPSTGSFPVIYSEQNFRGTTQAVERDFKGEKNWDGNPYRIRSIRVPQGWYLVVYEKKNYGGRSYNVDFDWSPTPDDYWYGKIRSIKVYQGKPPKQPR